MRETTVRGTWEVIRRGVIPRVRWQPQLTITVRRWASKITSGLNEPLCVSGIPPSTLHTVHFPFYTAVKVAVLFSEILFQAFGTSTSTQWVPATARRRLS